MRIRAFAGGIPASRSFGLSFERLRSLRWEGFGAANGLYETKSWGSPLTWRVGGLSKWKFYVISIITPIRVPFRVPITPLKYLLTKSPDPPSREGVVLGARLRWRTLNSKL